VEEDLRPLCEFGEPVLAQLGPMPYTVMNSFLDGGYPDGSLNYRKSSFLAGLPDTAFDTIEFVVRC